MATTPHIADVNQQTFESLVLAKSREIPVLVDFWAAWCGPCKILMPVLEKLADEYRGKFFLAKVNSDVEQALAARYAVKSLPTVKLFWNGQPVDEFLGVQAEKSIRNLLDRYIPRESDTLVHNAIDAARAGRHDEALSILQKATQADPDNDRAKLELARLYGFLGHADAADSTLASLSSDGKESADAIGIRAQLEFERIVAGARPANELMSVIAENPDDCMAHYELAAHLVLRHEYPAALDHLLDIVRTDRKFSDDAGRKAMILVFNLLGGTGEIVNDYRRQLSLALN